MPCCANNILGVSLVCRKKSLLTSERTIMSFLLSSTIFRYITFAGFFIGIGLRQSGTIFGLPNTFSSDNICLAIRSDEGLTLETSALPFYLMVV